MAYYEMMPAGLPAGLQSGMDSVLNKKFGTSTTYPPADWPDTVNLMGVLPEKTVSGAISVIEDGADDVPTKSVKIAIPASLSGVSAVSVVQTGRNLITTPNYTATTPTMVLDLGEDKTFDAVTLSFLATNAMVESTTAAVVDYRKDDETHQYRTLNWFRDENNVIFQPNVVQNGRFSNAYSNISFRYVYIYYQYSNYSKFASDAITEWQLELGSTASAYTPYIAPDTYTASLGRTIYGGEVDIVNGVGTDENGNDFTFTGQEVPTRLGYNAFWSDEGDTEVTYRRDIDLALGGN